MDEFVYMRESYYSTVCGMAIYGHTVLFQHCKISVAYSLQEIKRSRCLMKNVTEKGPCLTLKMLPKLQ